MLVDSVRRSATNSTSQQRRPPKVVHVDPGQSLRTGIVHLTRAPAHLGFPRFGGPSCVKIDMAIDAERP